MPTGERAPGAEEGAGLEAGRPREDAASPAPRSLEEAILWHCGEAEASRQAYLALASPQRQALLQWLRQI